MSEQQAPAQRKHRSPTAAVLIIAGKLLLCYLLAGAVQLLVARYPDYAGHAHLPFSSFPGFLIWTPAAPLLSLTQAPRNWGSVAVFALTFAALLALALGKRQRR